MPFEDAELENLKKMVSAEQSDTIDDNRVQGDFIQFFNQTIVDDSLKTMVIEYDKQSSTLKIQVFTYSLYAQTAKVYTYAAREESYLQFCREYLYLDTERDFSSSSNSFINGVAVRVFAIMPPYKEAPLIVISTAKKPPEKIPSISELDEKKLKEIVTDNFLIVGKSGSGKTYLLNYMLHKFFPKDHRLGVIQEFNEIYPPNEFTDLITTTTRVPGQAWNDLEFLTEESNLMRYDNIIVGEIKGSEAWPFVVNCSSGTHGGATVHGITPQGGLQRLRTLCLLARPNISESIVDSFIKDAINYVIMVENAQITSISQLVTVNKGKFSLDPLDGNELNNFPPIN